MSYSVDPSSEGAQMELSRILSRELFIYFLDLEVKRARRYQNFFSILILRLSQLASHDNGTGLQNCYQKLSHLLEEELRESDILGTLAENRLVALLPYADLSAGGHAKSHFEGSLRYYDFKSEGYEVVIEQVCFPVDGTDTPDIVEKVIGPEAH
jgi:hypothetical protein